MADRSRELREKALKGGTRYLPKLREQHKLTARERLDLLLDGDSFIEDGLFANVLADELPALTVGSLAITATWRSSIVPRPVTTPSAGSSSASAFANSPSSTNDPLSSSRSSRSRAASLCCSRSLGR